MSSGIGAAVVAGLHADGHECLEWGRDPARPGPWHDVVDPREPEQVQADDVAAAVHWVVGSPPHVCLVGVDLQPQRTP